MKANIPEGLTSDHQEAIEGILRPILRELEEHGAGQIVVCLNETKAQTPAPRFVGYLLGKNMDDIRVKRGEPDPGVARFGHTPTSFMYEESLNKKGGVLKLDWTRREHLLQMRPTEHAQSLKRGIKYLMLRAVNLDGKWAGVVGIGFENKPKDEVIFEGALTKIATSSTLVDYLQQKFQPGGPAATSDTKLFASGERKFETGGPLATSDTNTQLEDTIRQVSAGISQAISQEMNKLADVLRTLYSRY